MKKVKYTNLRNYPDTIRASCWSLALQVEMKLLCKHWDLIKYYDYTDWCLGSAVICIGIFNNIYVTVL